MPEPFLEIAERMLVGPVWPASILAALLVVYTLLGMLGLLDLGLDLPEMDADPSFGPDLTQIIPFDMDFLQGIGGMTVRWTNFSRLPIILWGGIFTVVFWAISYGLWHQFDSQRYAPDWAPSLLLMVRNVVLAVGLTKITTQPLLRYFIPPPIYNHETLIGEKCEISTSEATDKFGQAKYRTNAAPLLLNVQTDGSIITKGEQAIIIGFDPEQRIYKVTQHSTEPSA